MQHLNTLSQIVNAASTLTELARSAQTYTFNIGDGATCYLHLKGGEVRINRNMRSQVEITSQLQAPFAWRIAAEQDEAGVYFVALRRPVVGAMGSAVFFVTVPFDTHLVLRLDNTRLTLDSLSGVVEVPPHLTTLNVAAPETPSLKAPKAQRKALPEVSGRE